MYIIKKKKNKTNKHSFTTLIIILFENSKLISVNKIIMYYLNLVHTKICIEV